MHEVAIPNNMMEGDYTLVLNRNAAEWVTGNANIPFYTFHSCADITITGKTIYFLITWITEKLGR